MEARASTIKVPTRSMVDLDAEIKKGAEAKAAPTEEAKADSLTPAEEAKPTSTAPTDETKDDSTAQAEEAKPKVEEAQP